MKVSIKMFKDYYSFKKKDKRIRWVYDRELSEWKREDAPRYAERYLNIYLLWWMLAAALVVLLFFLFVHIKFTNRLAFRFFDSPLIFLVWIIYSLTILFIGFFSKKFIWTLVLSTIISSTAFFTSDMLQMNYDTPLYRYIAISFALSTIYAIIIQLVRALINRKPKKDEKKGKNTL